MLFFMGKKEVNNAQALGKITFHLTKVGGGSGGFATGTCPRQREGKGQKSSVEEKKYLGREKRVHREFHYCSGKRRSHY